MEDYLSEYCAIGLGLPLQLFGQQFIDHLGVGLAGGGFHDLADEKAHDLVLAGPVGRQLSLWSRYERLAILPYGRICR